MITEANKNEDCPYVKSSKSPGGGGEESSTASHAKVKEGHSRQQLRRAGAQQSGQVCLIPAAERKPT